jgi:nitronate monooxygenase
VRVLDATRHAVVLAPLAGGPSTPELTAAVAEARAFAFLAAGYLAPQALRDRVRAVRSLTARPVGVNLFVPGKPANPEVVARYADVLGSEAGDIGVVLGEPRFHDDDWDEKLELLVEEPVEVVSFTFGCPSSAVMQRLRDRGSEIWVTVTTPEEAIAAEAAGVDVLVAQGAEAGGHRGTWSDEDPAIAGYGVLSLVQLVRHSCRTPVVAAGGIATGAAIGAVLAAGARAAALGTAFMLCPEAGTAQVHRDALAGSAPTALTRAFTGRMARGIRNRMIDAYSDLAPSAYPEVHHLTAPLRQAGRQNGDAGVVNLWAGQAYRLAQALPAAEIVEQLVAALRTSA